MLHFEMEKEYIGSAYAIYKDMQPSIMPLTQVECDLDTALTLHAYQAMHATGITHPAIAMYTYIKQLMSHTNTPRNPIYVHAIAYYVFKKQAQRYDDVMHTPCPF